MVEQAQSGFRFRYDIRETPDKGRGVFALEPIPEGRIVWRFVPGLYTVYDAPSFRTALGQLSRENAIYELTHTFGLRDFPDCAIRVLDDGVLINHSERANLATNFGVPLRAMLGAASPDHLQVVASALCEDRFALIATRDIAAGEELTNNYAEDEFDPQFYLELYEQFGVEETYLD